MTNQTLITRKELSLLCGLSVDEIRFNESRLGLTGAKVQITKRVRYRKTKAIMALKGAGVLE